MEDPTQTAFGANSAFVRNESKPYLIVLYPRERFRRVELPLGSLRVGRGEDCGLALDDELVSRAHCMVEWDGRSIRVRDLGSTNGTFVDGASITDEPRLLGEGQHLQIGRQILKVSFKESVEIAYERELFEAATTDPLTRIPNRRSFLERAQAEWSAARRASGWLHALIIDADHFKKVNDTLGHAAGDFVLRELAALCNRTRRSEDLLARQGGEEFAMLLSGIQPGQALAFAERLRTSIANLHLSYDDQPLALTVSIGIASRQGPSLPSLTDLIARADAALYQAKKEGRNRVCADQQ